MLVGGYMGVSSDGINYLIYTFRLAFGLVRFEEFSKLMFKDLLDQCDGHVLFEQMNISSITHSTWNLAF